MGEWMCVEFWFSFNMHVGMGGGKYLNCPPHSIQKN